MEQTYMTIKQAAQALNITRQRVHQLIQAGKLQAIRENGHHYISPEAMMAYQQRPSYWPRVIEDGWLSPGQAAEKLGVKWKSVAALARRAGVATREDARGSLYLATAIMALATERAERRECRRAPRIPVIREKLSKIPRPPKVAHVRTPSTTLLPPRFCAECGATIGRRERTLCVACNAKAKRKRLNHRYYQRHRDHILAHIKTIQERQS